MATAKQVDKMIGNLATSLSQGERAMIELGWTHNNIRWRETLDALGALARASASEPELFPPVAPDYADSAE